MNIKGESTTRKAQWRKKQKSNTNVLLVEVQWKFLVLICFFAFSVTFDEARHREKQRSRATRREG